MGTIARLVRKQIQAKIVFLIHNVLPHEPRPWDPQLARFALSSGHSHVVQSRAEGKALQQLQADATPVVATMPLFEQLTADAIPAALARRRLGVPDEGPLLLFFGFVRPYKGLRFLLQALPRVRARLPKVHLLVAGEFWQDKDTYLELVDQLNLWPTVTLLDYYLPNEEASLCFSAADVVVLPYVRASQSAVIPLAFGYGRPVITTAVGGLVDLVRDGENGLLIPPGDSEALATAVIDFFQQNLGPTFRHTLGPEEKRRSWESLVDRIEAAVTGTAPNWT
jgi:glycosyltransferase involved in cell wall biosynthesis